MTKHGRDDEPLEEFPLQHSIKKMKIGGESPFGAQQHQLSMNLANHYEANTHPEERHMRQMNQLLGSLHTLRLERKAERTRNIVGATPESFRSSQESDVYSNSMDMS